MTEMERTELIAREAIRDLLGRYTWAADRGRVAEVAACFCADGELDVGEFGGTWRGREVIADALRAVGDRLAPAGDAPGPVNHHVSSVQIDMADPTAAVVRSYFCVFTDIGADHWGTYRDSVVFDAGDGGWRFARRVVRVTGSSPASRFVDRA